MYYYSYYYKHEVYLIDSSKTIGIFLEVLNIDPLFLKLNHFICIYAFLSSQFWVIIRSYAYL